MRLSASTLWSFNYVLLTRNAVGPFGLSSAVPQLASSMRVDAPLTHSGVCLVASISLAMCLRVSNLAPVCS
ncbi:hypothetical protein CROQUDRAFT_88207 [Cronartium quercuum f. sp. fusiforme G11]|uniref:Uncharacterized protein n=1 Tax=Cronartium quercuum f. sp. fusiforme G11 TaxID=708437 RepID=A0A9P6TFX4_9BASI|nr:hypothetical protein CROQUDRAFT_88207 [Cronartium quercuum f. sp. fusiforme G11]